MYLKMAFMSSKIEIKYGSDTMKLIDLSVREFVYKVESASPAPGGGSVSALAATLGTGLLRMMGHLTIPKKKFKGLDDAVQSEYITIHESLKKDQKQLLDLIDRDTDAFNEIMDAFKLPKTTDKEKKYRKKAIENATIKAIEIPEKIADIALGALEKVDFIRKYGNKNAISDVGVSALMLYAGLEGACLNIKINLSGLSDQTQKREYKDKVQSLLNEGIEIKNGCMRAIHDVLDEG